MNIFILALLPPELERGLHLKAQKFPIENFWNSLRKNLKANLEKLLHAQSIGVDIAYIQQKSNFGKVAHRVCMTASTINWKTVPGV
jgi:hypothetical protein